MKKILFHSLFAACAALSMSSCFNGDYDANPASTNSGTNPLNTGSNGGGGGSSTNISCKVNGTSYSFSGKYQIIGSQRSVGGSRSDGDNGSTVNLTITNYSGPKTYDLATEGSGNYTTFSISNPTGSQSVWSTVSTASPGTGSLIVTSDDNNTMKGTFNFTANRVTGSGGSAQVVVTEGTFEVKP